ncbi:hypothetical protein QOZ80_3BG0264390 [Eleusine coracana subsp. coracana]|nr:hypothetical protein QOZ80_3BG0264390 [Eleusine coracana subsp. coracana]
MAAARRSPPLVLSGRVNMWELTGEPGPGWTLIKCIRRKAYGCGEHGQEIVEGLKLYMHPGDRPVLTSSMAIRMSDEALRSIDLELELGRPRKDRWPRREIDGGGIVQIAEQNLIVLTLVFHRLYRRDLVYHLVYDAIDASLSLFKYLPDGHEVAYGLKPVPLRASDGRDYSLILNARAIGDPEFDPSTFLCIVSTKTRAVGTTDPWLIKKPVFTSMAPDSFSADVAFSFKGKPFWADLSEGVLYCDLPPPSFDKGYNFIRLPEECQLDLNTMPKDEPLKMTRTIGCVGDSIWFVYIKRYESYANDVVTTWTLDLTDKEWKQVENVSAKVLWSLDSFKDVGLPEAQLEYPVLTADGTLGLVLPDQCELTEYGPVEDCICGFDMSLKNLLWHGRVHNYSSTKPVILPSDFFQMSHKRKWAELCRNAELK